MAAYATSAAPELTWYVVVKAPSGERSDASGVFKAGTIEAKTLPWVLEWVLELMENHRRSVHPDATFAARWTNYAGRNVLPC
jgi:hypothetical protein